MKIIFEPNTPFLGKLTFFLRRKVNALELIARRKLLSLMQTTTATWSKRTNEKP